MVLLGSATVYMIQSFIGRAREEPQRSGHLNLISLVFFDSQLKPEQLADKRLPHKDTHAPCRKCACVRWAERFWNRNEPCLAFLL